MPRGTAVNDALIRLLMIGDAKAGKSQYIMEAAKAGFNIIYLDCDAATKPTLQMMPTEVKERILYFDIHDSNDKARASIIVSNILKSTQFLWNDTEGRMYSDVDLEFNPNTEVWELTPVKLNNKTILVIDSWTGLVDSVIKDVTGKLQLDLMDTSNKQSDLRPLYQPGRLKLTAFLNVLQHLPCHLYVTAHPDTLEIYEQAPGKVSQLKEKDRTLIGTKKIPYSISKAHGDVIGKFFTDVLWIYQSHGDDRIIDGRPDPNRVIGSRFNERKKSKEYSFANLVSLIGGELPGKDAPLESPGLKCYGPGEYQPPEPKAQAPLGEKKSSTPTSKKVQGLRTLVKNQKAN